jgi:hypothetical protein
VLFREIRFLEYFWRLDIAKNIYLQKQYSLGYLFCPDASLMVDVPVLVVVLVSVSLRLYVPERELVECSGSLLSLSLCDSS